MNIRHNWALFFPFELGRAGFLLTVANVRAAKGEETGDDKLRTRFREDVGRPKGDGRNWGQGGRDGSELGRDKNRQAEEDVEGVEDDDDDDGGGGPDPQARIDNERRDGA